MNLYFVMVLCELLRWTAVSVGPGASSSVSGHHGGLCEDNLILLMKPVNSGCIDCHGRHFWDIKHFDASFHVSAAVLSADRLRMPRWWMP